MDFGTRLKQLRKENNITQTDIAEILNTTKSTVSRYEGNTVEPNLDTLNRLSEYFNVSIDYLLGKSILKSPNGLVAFHLEEDELDPDDIKLIQELIESLKKKHKNSP